MCLDDDASILTSPVNRTHAAELFNYASEHVGGFLILDRLKQNRTPSDIRFCRFVLVHVSSFLLPGTQKAPTNTITHPKFLISNAKRNNNNPTTAGTNENTRIQIGSDLNENLVTFMAFDRLPSF